MFFIYPIYNDKGLGNSFYLYLFVAKIYSVGSNLCEQGLLNAKS